MHGREGEQQRSHRRHMWPVPASTTSSVAAIDFNPITPDSFFKDGRKISVSDCALFKPPQDSPPFVGIIRRLVLGKEDNLTLCVNWLYRPADVKLGKGNLLEAAPNEVFYSFHKDEIPAASLLHPCKVAFLRKGVELPSGISSFVCRRVYDIESERLWWLTDQDYVNASSMQERQEEVDQLLDKTRVEMYGAVQSGGRSPKTVNCSTGAPQPKAGSDSAQNSSSSFPSQAKGKKRELGVQGSEPVKRERMSRADDTDYSQLRPEQMLKSEIAKITDRGGLIDFEGVEKLVQLMQPDSVEKKLDLACRIMLANVIAVTDSIDCLNRFVQLRGLPVLDDWLQQVHKGKIGDVSYPKESDKSVEEFLLALLRALDKLPVNLHALQTCNIGKSVNHLRTHKNSEIQKKARSLVDTWKKRVEVEMNMIDAKSGSSRGGSWPNKTVISEVSNVVGRRNGGPSDPVLKSSNMQSCASKTPPGSGDKFSTASPGSSKLPTSVTASGVANEKDLNSVANVGAVSSDPLLTTIKEEKSSSSSQSQNNSQSCSSDYGKMVSCREDARSSTAGSVSANKVSSGVSRNRKLSNGLHGTPLLGVQKESSFGKSNSVNRTLPSEKVSPTRVISERIPDAPLVDNGNNQRLIVRLPNTVRSPARSASGGSPEDASAAHCKGSPLAHSEKLELQDRKVKGRSEALRSSNVLNANMDSCQWKDLAGSDEAKMTNVGVHCVEQSRDGEGSEKLTEASKATSSPSGITAKPGKSYEASFSSMNALIDSCAKFSEANATASVGDDIGMNLLASVAAGEISRSDVSPLGSPQRKSPVPEESCSGNDELRQTDEDRARSEDQHNDESKGGATIDHGNSINSLLVKTGIQRNDVHMSTDFSGDSKVTLVGCEEKTGECGAQLNSSGMDLPHNDGGPVLTSDAKLPESVNEDSAAMSSLNVKKEVIMAGEGADQPQEMTWARDVNASNLKLRARSPFFEDKNIGCANETTIENGVVVLPEAAATCAKVETDANEESTSCSSSDRHDDDKNTVNKLSGSCNLKEQNLPHVICGNSEHTELRSGSCAVSGTESMVEKADEMKSSPHTEHIEEQRLGVGSSTFDYRGEIAHGNPEKKEATGVHPGGSSPTKSPALPVQGTEQLMKSSNCKEDGAENLASRPTLSSVTAVGTDTAVKLDFDLNEGLPVDDGSTGELKLPVYGNSSSVHLPFPLPISISSMPGSLPSSITVAAAAKGPFVPPENPLRIKGELRWKGSAATSAFRPAEPRKILDMPLSTTGSPLVDNSSSKHGRPLLDFDLNVPDQRVLEDVAPQNSESVIFSESGHERSGGGLNLDLNRCDESPDIGQFSVSNSCKLEIPKLPGGRSSLSGGFSIAESNASRDFDLNNGPGLDELGSEAAPHSKNSLPFMASVPNVRMNNMELGNFSSWFPPGTSYSAIAMPPVLPGRGEQNYSILPAASSQRILGPPSGCASFGPEIYRGPVLSSSPAVGFPPTTPFQYPGFPFETNFPLSSNSYSAVSTAYADSSSGGPLCFPAIPSQLMGPGVVSTHYSRPYVMNHLPGGTSAVVPETRKWGNQGLDLNAGPVVADLERRDERLPSALRQLPLSGSKALADEQLKMYQMAGGVLKRKEPDGGWDGDRISYKNPSWQ